MIRVLVATLVFMVGVPLAHAQNLAVIDQRQKAFKSMLPDLKVGKAMVKGDQAFDAAAAKKVFTTYAAAAAALKSLFPEDSKTGGETRALPAIWEKKADFDAKLAAFEQDAMTAAGAVPDLASFKTAWGKVMSNCGGCHKPYRAEKEKK
ncbi:MAG TPA: cytochrome c [Hyphomicrobiaceae bacterium]|nr:cytochrome c [Hyphomicrobiaceae bacterium]